MINLKKELDSKNTIVIVDPILEQEKWDKYNQELKEKYSLSRLLFYLFDAMKTTIFHIRHFF